LPGSSSQFEPGAAPPWWRSSNANSLCGQNSAGCKSVRAFKGITCNDISEFESYHLSHAVRSPPSPCTGRAASHGPAPWLPGRRERRVEARAGALHNEHVDAVVSSIERPLNARLLGFRTILSTLWPRQKANATGTTIALGRLSLHEFKRRSPLKERPVTLPPPGTLPQRRSHSKNKVADCLAPMALLPRGRRL
jgi:hypothetical protein